MKEIIPELHDIGKLASDELKIAGHTFDDFKFEEKNIEKPNSPSWWGQYHHKRKDKRKPDDWETDDEINKWKDIPDDYKGDLFILILSDHLAASSSRSTLEIGTFTPDNTNSDIQKVIMEKLGIKKLDRLRGIVKLWNKKYYQEEETNGQYWAAFRTEKDIDKIFSEIQNCHSGMEFLTKYENYLRLTPEDKSLPRNITSLYTHVELVGKIFSVLKKFTYFEKCGEEYIIKLNNENKVRLISEAEGSKRTVANNQDDIKKGKFQGRMIKCHICSNQTPVRLHDLNIFKKRNELINDLVDRYRDNVLFHTPDFIELLLTENDDLHEIFRKFTEAGFTIRCVETTADLGILKSNLSEKVLKARENQDIERIKVLNNRNTKVKIKIISSTPDLDIKTGICEVCQSNEHLDNPWFHENVKEWICQNCWDIRNSHQPFSEYYNEWQGEKVCWFKFSLEQDKLEKWLQKSFEEYIEIINQSYTLTQKDTLISEFRPLALQVDFNNDYRKLLDEFWMAIEENIRIKKPIAEYDELGVFLYSAELATKIIQIYIYLMEKYLPDCPHDEDSPVSLALSFANIKYPVREHLRFFNSECNNFLNIHNQNIYKGGYSEREVKQIMNIIEKLKQSEISKNSLYDVIQSFEKLNSEIELTLRLKDRGQDVYQLYVNEGILPERFLNLYQLLKGGD
ncbi:MAG TPA: hypothetical protein P5268_04460 [Candidatus Marinimicrobia bacterium]|nr:hypothetical protein [Candidatus Neomarinimicrobiota bacterium]